MFAFLYSPLPEIVTAPDRTPGPRQVRLPNPAPGASLARKKVYRDVPVPELMLTRHGGGFTTSGSCISTMWGRGPWVATIFCLQWGALCPPTPGCTLTAWSSGMWYDYPCTWRAVWGRLFCLHCTRQCQCCPYPSECTQWRTVNPATDIPGTPLEKTQRRPPPSTPAFLAHMILGHTLHPPSHRYADVPVRMTRSPCSTPRSNDQFRHDFT